MTTMYHDSNIRSIGYLQAFLDAAEVFEFHASCPRQERARWIYDRLVRFHDLPMMENWYGQTTDIRIAVRVEKGVEETWDFFRKQVVHYSPLSTLRSCGLRDASGSHTPPASHRRQADSTAHQTSLPTLFTAPAIACALSRQPDKSTLMLLLGMREQLNTTELLEAAERYTSLSLPIIPLNGKVPAIKQWQEFIATQISLHFWFGTHGCNIGLRTGESGYVVIDTDTPEAEAWVQSHCPPTPMQVITGSGSRHHYYAEPPRKKVGNKQALRGISGLDIRGHGGFIVLPPSRHPEMGCPYAWNGDVLPPDLLPRFLPAWVYRRTRQRMQSAIAGERDPQSLLYRGKLYVTKFDRAVSGQGGHTTTLKSAFKILRFVNFDESLAWELMQFYNETRCDPPWNEPDLKRKLHEAMRLSSR